MNFNVSIDENYDTSIGEIKVFPHDLSRVILNIANNGAWSAWQKAKRLGEGEFKPALTVTTQRQG